MSRMGPSKPAPEAVDGPAAPLLGEPGEEQLLVGEALAAQIAGEVVPALGAVADAEVHGRGLVEATLGEEDPAGVGLGSGGELFRVPLGGDLVRLDETDAFTALVGGVVAALLVAQGDAGLGGEPLDHLGEGEVVDLHHERDGVAALLAAEAVEQSLARADLEGRRLLVVEGAQALEVAAARVAQLEVLGHHGVDRDRVPYRLHVLVVDPSCHEVILRGRADISGGPWCPWGARGRDMCGSPAGRERPHTPRGHRTTAPRTTGTRPRRRGRPAAPGGPPGPPCRSARASGSASGSAL